MKDKPLLRKFISGLMVMILVLVLMIPNSVYIHAGENQENQYKEHINEVIKDVADWLYDRQEEGVWGDKEFINDTCEAIEVLKDWNKDADFSASYAWLEEQMGDVKEADNDLLARYILTGLEAKEQLEQLKASQNEDGGFGLNAYYKSDVYDSMLALQALTKADSDDMESILYVIDYLCNQQNEDGGWGYTENAESDTWLT